MAGDTSDDFNKNGFACGSAISPERFMPASPVSFKRKRPFAKLKDNEFKITVVSQRVDMKKNPARLSEVRGK